jgi:DNA (cytosine-5)-methyltransferase 1
VGGKRLTSLEIFTGAGGLALGISRAGFRHLALIERDQAAITSLVANRSTVNEMRSWPISKATDVRKFDFSAFTDRVDILGAGAPCQPFSLGGKHLGHVDERNQFPAVFAAVRAVRPKAVVLENVRGLQRRTFNDYFEYIKIVLSFPGVTQRLAESWQSHYRRLMRHSITKEGKLDKEYVVESALLNAADYGIGQSRQRLFIVALMAGMNEAWVPPKPTHDRVSLLRSQWVTGKYWKDHGLKAPRMPGHLRSRISDFENRTGELERWQTVRDVIRGLPEPKNGREADGYTNHVNNPGARVYPGHSGSRLDWPAKTLKAGYHGVPGGENILVRARRVPRYFTVREAARLQGFPDAYTFVSSWCDAFKQLGNAVPVTLAERVAESVAVRLREYRTK